MGSIWSSNSKQKAERLKLERGIEERKEACRLHYATMRKALFNRLTNDPHPRQLNYPPLSEEVRNLGYFRDFYHPDPVDTASASEDSESDQNYAPITVKELQAIVKEARPYLKYDAVKTLAKLGTSTTPNQKPFYGIHPFLGKSQSLMGSMPSLALSTPMGVNISPKLKTRDRQSAAYTLPNHLRGQERGQWRNGDYPGQGPTKSKLVNKGVNTSRNSKRDQAKASSPVRPKVSFKTTEHEIVVPEALDELLKETKRAPKVSFASSKKRRPKKVTTVSGPPLGKKKQKRMVHKVSTPPQETMPQIVEYEPKISKIPLKIVAQEPEPEFGRVHVTTPGPLYSVDASLSLSSLSNLEESSSSDFQASVSTIDNKEEKLVLSKAPIVPTSEIKRITVTSKPEVASLKETMQDSRPNTALPRINTSLPWNTKSNSKKIAYPLKKTQKQFISAPRHSKSFGNLKGSMSHPRSEESGNLEVSFVSRRSKSTGNLKASAAPTLAEFATRTTPRAKVTKETVKEESHRDCEALKLSEVPGSSRGDVDATQNSKGLSSRELLKLKKTLKVTPPSRRDLNNLLSSEVKQPFQTRRPFNILGPSFRDLGPVQRSVREPLFQKPPRSGGQQSLFQKPPRSGVQEPFLPGGKRLKLRPHTLDTFNNNRETFVNSRLFCNNSHYTAFPIPAQSSKLRNKPVSSNVFKNGKKRSKKRSKLGTSTSDQCNPLPRSRSPQIRKKVKKARSLFQSSTPLFVLPETLDINNNATISQNMLLTSSLLSRSQFSRELLLAEPQLIRGILKNPRSATDRKFGETSSNPVAPWTYRAPCPSQDSQASVAKPLRSEGQGQGFQFMGIPDNNNLSNNNEQDVKVSYSSMFFSNYKPASCVKFNDEVRDHYPVELIPKPMPGRRVAFTSPSPRDRFVYTPQFGGYSKSRTSSRIVRKSTLARKMVAAQLQRQMTERLARPKPREDKALHFLDFDRYHHSK